ncbi:multiple antibiotic resistance protein [Pseudomonas sp. OV226]|nr:multiple antibiotic resistance protein [Pseudomonas sp. OV226]
MIINSASYQHYLLGLFAVANNISAIPLYLHIIQDVNPEHRNKICGTATLTAFLTMFVAMFAGLGILDFFEISIPAFRIAGGLLLINTGFAMLNSEPNPISATPLSLSKIISTAVIPIGIPMTTGAGTMTTIVLFSEASEGKPYMNFALMAAILTMTAIIYLAFKYAPKIVKLLDTTGLDVFTKIFGLITLALGIQFVLTGITGAFPKII